MNGMFKVNAMGGGIGRRAGLKHPVDRKVRAGSIPVPVVQIKKLYIYIK
jgi:hypothetical protein